MSAKKKILHKVSIAAVIFGLVAISSVLIIGKTVSRMAIPHHVGLVEDWSMHHLVFSNPGTYEQVKDDPAAYSRWLRLQYNTRFIMQQMKRRAGFWSPEVTSRPTPELSVPKLSFPQSSSLLANPFISSEAPSVARLKPGRKVGLNGLWVQNMLASSVLPNTLPAKYTFDPIAAPSCANDFVVYPTGTRSSTTAATIVAYRNLYVTTCTPTAPTIYWAYDTGGTTYSVTTSPVISDDGLKVAFIQTTSTAAQLVVVKFAASGGTVAAPATAPTLSTNISTCGAPCMSVTTITGVTTGITYSQPFYDYQPDDAVFVGDNASHLYKITGVFNSTTSPVATSVTLNPSTAYVVASPVYDPTSGCVFVGDSYGYLYSVSSGNAGTVCTGSTYARFGYTEYLGNNAANTGIFDGVLVDSSAQRVYAFITSSRALTGVTAGDNSVDQFTTGTITSGSTTAVPAGQEDLGPGGATYALYAGAFDNNYFTTGSPASPSGNIYVIGNTGSNSASANLYQVPINSNSLAAPTAVDSSVTSGSAYPWPSPVTEFFNSNVSVTATGTVTITSNPSGWSAGQQVKIGTTIYTFVTSLSAVNQVLIYSSSSTTNNERRTAENLQAVVNATSSQCYGGSGCLFTGQTVNASATASGATGSSNAVTLTSKTSGSAGDFNVSTTSGDLTATGGSNGESGRDYIFFSVYFGADSSCAPNEFGSAQGCVYSYDVTSSSAVTNISGLTITYPGGFNFSGFTYYNGCWGTGGFIIDSNSTTTGASQVYFVNLNGNFPTGITTNCASANSTTGNTVEAEQASQTALN